MPYRLPTVEQFRERFPEFASVSDARIGFFIDDAQLQVDYTWIESNYQPAILMLSAHSLIVEMAQEAGSGSGQIDSAGSNVRRRKVGDVEVELKDTDYAGGKSGLTAEYSGTPYGRRFLKMMRLNHPSIRAI